MNLDFLKRSVLFSCGMASLTLSHMLAQRVRCVLRSGCRVWCFLQPCSSPRTSGDAGRIVTLNLDSVTKLFSVFPSFADRGRAGTGSRPRVLEAVEAFTASDGLRLVGAGTGWVRSGFSWPPRSVGIAVPCPGCPSVWHVDSHGSSVVQRSNVISPRVFFSLKVFRKSIRCRQRE